MYNRGILIVLACCLAAASACDRERPGPPDGMVYLPGGTVTIGTDSGPMNERPAYQAAIQPFYIDKEPVTVGEFRRFAAETGYVTEAERFGNSAVFDVKTGEWILVEGASWKYPRGEGGPKAEDDHPATHISWNDARAYCAWAGARLPTEEEWEYAAKFAGAGETRFSWGNDLIEQNTYKANVWQGHFPDSVRVDDGYLYTSPVGAFGENAAGLSDMGGNVWEWTSDTYNLYEGNRFRVPADEKLKVIRGGSFLCDSTVCFGYRVTARNYNSRESAAFHLGFRTVREIGE